MLVEVAQLRSTGIVALLHIVVEGAIRLLLPLDIRLFRTLDTRLFRTLDTRLFRTLDARLFKALNALLLAAICLLTLNPFRGTNTELVHHQQSASLFKLLEVGEAALWNHGDLPDDVVRLEQVNALVIFGEVGVQGEVPLAHGEHAVGCGLV